MNVILSTSPFIPDEIRDEVINLQEQVYAINEIGGTFDRYSSNHCEWSERRSKLLKNVETFNNIQMEKALCGSAMKETSLLLATYERSYSCIQATAKTSKGYKEHNVFVTYRRRIVGFSEFFRAQHALYNQYSMLRKYFSSLSYCVFENSKKPIDGKYLFGLPGFHEKNPYTFYRTTTLTDKQIEPDKVVSIRVVKDYIFSAFKALFGDDLAPVSSRIVRGYLWNTLNKSSVESLIDLVFITYIFTKKNIDWGGIDFKPEHFVSRHVSWCTNRRGNKECMLLDQPCHSSTDCAFYREKNTGNANPARTSFFDE